MNLLVETQTLLVKNGYEVRINNTRETGLIFEDDSIIGAVAEFETVQALFDDWEKMQDSFLATHHGVMQRALDKAWNSYLVLLSLDAINAGDRDKVASIEEDLRGARKVVGAGIVTRADLEKALLPVLPIQETVKMTKEDHLRRLRQRLDFDALIDTDKPEDIFSALESSK